MAQRLQEEERRAAEAADAALACELAEQHGSRQRAVPTRSPARPPAHGRRSSRDDSALAERLRREELDAIAARDAAMARELAERDRPAPRRGRVGPTAHAYDDDDVNARLAHELMAADARELSERDAAMARQLAEEEFQRQRQPARSPARGHIPAYHPAPPDRRRPEADRMAVDMGYPGYAQPPLSKAEQEARDEELARQLAMDDYGE